MPDLRANALRAVTVMVDPSECCASPRGLQRAIRAALASLRKHGDDLPILALDRIGGKLFLVSYRLSGNICIDVSCWAPSVVASRGHLVAVVEQTLGDVTLTGTVR